jgi:hypothetical protein
MKQHLTSASFSPSEIHMSAISFVLTSYLLDTKVIALDYDNILQMDYITLAECALIIINRDPYLFKTISSPCY